jgi:FMN phosphatase YigB (HAD superfamily)
MAIRAVVFDIGSVLEIIDDSVFPGTWPDRLGLSHDEFLIGLAGFEGDPTIGEVNLAQVRGAWQRGLGLDDADTDALMADFWRWYVGTLDQPLFDWFAALRPRVRTGILSNSGPGAREAEACWGFEEVTDDIVYSHEVGLAKPDPAIYALTAARLGVLPHEIAFLDDVEENVRAARDTGWHAVLHIDTATSIREMERLLADG